MNIIRNSLLSLAAVGAFALAGAAQASGGVIYQGHTTLYNSATGTSTQCTLQVSGTIDSSTGAVQIDAAGARDNGGGDSTSCQYIYTGNQPWTGSTSSSTISTNTDSTLIYVPGLGIQGTCGGTLSGVSYGSGSPPASVTITSGGSGTFNYGTNCRLDGTLSLDP